MRSFSVLAIGALASVAEVSAQTYTECNPMEKECPNNPALGLSHNFVFNTSQTVDDAFNVTSGSLVYGKDGSEYTINKIKDSPTIQSKFYIFFGSVSVVMKAAKGTGIISSIVLESDDLDEVDWEFLGGNGTHAETNYFGKGNTTSFDRAIYHPMTSDPREDFHNYTIHWTSDKIEWYIDSALIRTLPYEAANGGHNFPQTPMNVRLGIWSGGDPENNPKGTVEWAGGVTDFTQGPFTMTVKSAEVTDFSTGTKEYNWSDKSGSWQSIKALSGNSTVAKAIEKTEHPSPSLSQKFAALPPATKLAVYGGGAAVAAILLAAFLFTCIRRRRQGKREHQEYEATLARERAEELQNQVELREKGLGGWNDREFESQGDDALGGWQQGTNMSKRLVSVSVNEASPYNSASSRHLAPSAVSPSAQSPQSWNGGHQYDPVQGSSNSGYSGFKDTRSPTLPLVSPAPPPNRAFTGGGYFNQGYEKV